MMKTQKPLTLTYGEVTMAFNVMIIATLCTYHVLYFCRLSRLVLMSTTSAMSIIDHPVYTISWSSSSHMLRLASALCFGRPQFGSGTASMQCPLDTWPWITD